MQSRAPTSSSAAQSTTTTPEAQGARGPVQLKESLRGLPLDAQEARLKPEGGPGGAVVQKKDAVQMAGEEGSTLKWGNPKSVPTYGHTFLRHGQKVKQDSMQERARAADTKKGVTNQCQIGAWNDDQGAADFLATAVKGHAPGEVFETSAGGGGGRSFLADGTRLTPDKARVVMRADGSIKTAYPFASGKQTDDDA